MIALIDTNGKVDWVNQEWESVLGWKFQDFQTGDVLEGLYPNPEYRQYVINSIWKIIQNPIHAVNFVLVNIKWVKLGF